MRSFFSLGWGPLPRSHDKVANVVKKINYAFIFFSLNKILELFMSFWWTFGVRSCYICFGTISMVFTKLCWRFATPKSCPITEKIHQRHFFIQWHKICVRVKNQTTFIFTPYEVTHPNIYIYIYYIMRLHGPRVLNGEPEQYIWYEESQNSVILQPVSSFESSDITE